MTYIGFDVSEMLPTQLGLEQRELNPEEVQKLHAEGAISRCFARHKPLLDTLLLKTGISIKSKATERIQYLVAGDQYIEIQTSEERVSFQLFKVTARKS